MSPAEQNAAEQSPAEQSAATPEPAVAPSAAPQPLTSLSALMGGAFESGQACDADGNCD